MPRVLALLTILAMLLTVPTAALAASLVSVATLEANGLQLGEGLVQGTAGDFFTTVSSPASTNRFLRILFGSTQIEETAVVSTGEVRRVTATGEVSVFSTLPAGPLFGLTMGPGGRHLYVSLPTGRSETHGIWRIDTVSGQPERYATLPLEAQPRGLTFRGTDLFVADGSNGRIYKVGTGRDSQVWASDALLKGRFGRVGASSLAFNKARPLGLVLGGTETLQEFLYVSNTDAGRVVRIPIFSDGSAGPVEELIRSSLLEGIRGFTFDTGPSGGSLIATVSSGNRLVAVSPAPDAKVQILAEAVPAPVNDLLQNGTLFVLSAGTPPIDNASPVRPVLWRVTDILLPVPVQPSATAP